jgi:hypothetical protein
MCPLLWYESEQRCYSKEIEVWCNIFYQHYFMEIIVYFFQQKSHDESI